MNKSDLVEYLAKNTDLTQKKSEKVINLVFKEMTRALKTDDKIEIRGFGSFQVRHYDRHQGRNPKTGEIVDVKPKKLPFFKVGRGLLERLNAE